MTSTFAVSLEENSGVLLLGASGRLGRMLCRNWQAPPGLVAHSRQAQAEFITFDLMLEPEMAVAAMAGKCAFICRSGVTPARVASHGEVYSRNTDLALAALYAAAQAGVPRVFLASSAAVYGAAEGVQDETVTPQPVADYGHAKLDMENAAFDLAAGLGQAVTALRIGNVAGGDAILGGWRDGMQLDQLPDGTTPRRSYIGPQTLTRIIAQLCQTADLPQVLNIATPAAVEMGALLDAAHLPWSPRPAQGGVIAKVELSTKLLERYVTFAPEDSTTVAMVAEWQLGMAQE